MIESFAGLSQRRPAWMGQTGWIRDARFTPGATHSAKRKKRRCRRISFGWRVRAMFALRNGGPGGRANRVALPAARLAELRIQSAERLPVARAPARLSSR